MSSNVVARMIRAGALLCIVATSPGVRATTNVVMADPPAARSQTTLAEPSAAPATSGAADPPTPAQYPDLEGKPQSVEALRAEIQKVQRLVDDLTRQVELGKAGEEELLASIGAAEMAKSDALALKADLGEGLQKISGASCQPGADFEGLAQHLVDGLDELAAPSRTVVKLRNTLANAHLACAQVQAMLADSGPTVLREAEKMVDKRAAELSKLKRQHGTLTKDVDHLEAGQRRLAELQAASSATIAGADVTGKLPVLIAFLGVFSLSIMVMVRRFTPDIQREWVQSGQVIQFMTVTVIVIAVLSLGLAQKLSPENLGTLLGTIGGYVLAQGIGRSASRDPRNDKTGRQGADVATAPKAPVAPSSV